MFQLTGDGPTSLTLGIIGLICLAFYIGLNNLPAAILRYREQYLASLRPIKVDHPQTATRNKQAARRAA